MTFGIVSTGFNTKRLPDILAEIEAYEKDSFGEIDVSGEGGLGQLNAAFGKQCADIWEQLQNSYYAASPVSAEGVSLDYNVALNGIERLPALPTVANVGLHGTYNAIIPAGTQVRNSSTQELFQLVRDTQITNQNQLQILYKIDDIADGQPYTIAINSFNYGITSGSGSTADSIAQQLVDEILLDPAREAEPTKLPDGVIQLDKIDTVPFNSGASLNIIFFTPSIFESINLGEILALANTLDTIETPVSGLDEVNNFIDGEKGRGEETDDELRIRREENVQTSTGGTLPSIVSAIRNQVAGVITVKGYENRTDITDGDGRPPHSIEIIVEGGTDQDIANKLWEVKGGGINTFGNTSKTITDGNGDIQTMFFSRPVLIDIWIKATLTLYNEEQFPTDGEDQVKQKILDYGNTLDIGEDVIGQRFYGPIFEIPGIGNIVIEISETTPPPYTGGAQIAIDASERSSFSLSRIDVNIP